MPTTSRLVRLPLLPVILSLAVCLPAAGPAGAQQPDELRVLRQEIETLRQEQARLRGEIQALRELLQRERAAPATRRQPQARPEATALSMGDSPTKGDQGAKLVLVEFTDYQ
jgi:hypothetical protein